MMGVERVKHPRRQRRRVILIQPISYHHGSDLSTLAPEDHYKHTQIADTVLQLLHEFCSAYFPEMRVELLPPLDLLDIPHLTSRVHEKTNRRQFLVDDIINFLSAHRLKKAYCVLGVTTVDLYPGPEWNFVLGQASLESGSGVFSFGRYFNSWSSSSATMDPLVVEEGREMVEDQSGEETTLEKQSGECEMEQMCNIWVLMRVSQCDSSFTEHLVTSAQ